MSGYCGYPVFAANEGEGTTKLFEGAQPDGRLVTHLARRVTICLRNCGSFCGNAALAGGQGDMTLAYTDKLCTPVWSPSTADAPQMK